VPLDLQFTETDSPREVEVTTAEQRALRRARHGLSIEAISDSRIRVGPRLGYVGTVLLPSGGRLVVKAKAPIASLPDLLVLAYRTLALPAPSGVASVEETSPTEWLLLQLADEVNELVGRGLRRGYVEKREFLPFLRGRVRPPTNPARLPSLDCEYVEFTSDTIENRLLRSTLELLAPAVRNRAIRKRVYSALEGFGEIASILPIIRSFDRVNLTRLNSHYQPALRLARLALEGAGVTDEAGAISAPAYFVPLWRVWEAAMAGALREAGVLGIREQPEYSDRIVQTGGFPKLTVTINPDLIIGPRLAPRMLIDLKWTPALQLRHGEKRLRNDHLYQLSTYCTALGCDGILVYPQIDDPVCSDYTFKGRKIYLRTIDLQQSALRDLRSFANRVADEVNL
jgi:5-methylcytosine-specific restriction enzyme subunit McrC